MTFDIIFGHFLSRDEVTLRAGETFAPRPFRLRHTSFAGIAGHALLETCKHTAAESA